MSKEDKSLKMKKATAKLAKDTKAFVVIRIDSNDRCDMMFDGNVYETLLMRETLSQFISKFINGEINQ